MHIPFPSHRATDTDLKGAIMKKILRGSLTIEATLVLPVFMFFVSSLIYLLVIIYLQTGIQLSMENAARSLGKKAYIAAAADIDAVINTDTIRWAVLTDELTESIEESGIIRGVSGFDTIYSIYESDIGIIDIAAEYEYEIPLLPDGIGRLKFIRRMRSRAWIGAEISGEEGTSGEGQIVFITPTGSVYHTTTACSYLDMSLRSAAFDQIDEKRNLNGEKYRKCAVCVKDGDYSLVYVTDYGNTYHATLSCVTLKRNVIAVDISEVDGRSECSKCGTGQ